jgi:phosphosulfolactate synthase (CoM biosynthesis protein A)
VGKGHFEDVLRGNGLSCRWAEVWWWLFLVPGKWLKDLINNAHSHGVYVSIGGWIEHVPTQQDAKSVVDGYLHKYKDFGL